MMFLVYILHDVLIHELPYKQKCNGSNTEAANRRFSVKKDVFESFAILQESTVLEPLFNKVAGLQACNLIIKRLQHTFSLQILRNF